MARDNPRSKTSATSVFRGEDGRWVVQVPLATTVEGKRWFKTTYADSEEEANDALKSFQTELSSTITDLPEAEHRWWFALESAGYGLWDWSILNHTESLSKSWKKIFGFEGEEIPISNEQWIQMIHPDDQEKMLTDMQAHMDCKTNFFVNEHRGICKDGSWLWVKSRGFVVERDSAGKPLRMLGTTADISKFKAQQFETEAKQRILETIANGTPLAELLTSLVLEFETLIPGTTGSVLLLDSTGKHLRHGAGPNLPPAYCEAIDGVEIGPEVGSCGTAAYTGKTTMVSDIATDPLWRNFKDLALSFGLHACWSVPISGATGSILGTFTFYFNQPRVAMPEELALIARGAHLASMAIEREVVQAVLRENELRWKFAVEGAGDGLWDWNVLESTVYFSHRWKEMLGFRDDEIGNGLEEWSKRVHPDDLEQTMIYVKDHLEGNTPSYSSRHRVACKDGTWKWILDRGIVVERDSDGNPLRMIGTHSDVTEQKQSELELVALSIWQKTLLDTDNHAIISTSPEGIIHSYNPAAKNMFGYSAAELIGTKSLAFFADRAEVKARAKQFSEELNEPVKPGIETFIAKALRGLPNEHQWTLTRKDGTKFIGLLSVTALKDDKDVITGYMGLTLDITERIRSEEEIRRLNTELERRVVQRTEELIVAKEEAEIANRAKSDFLSHMSHELRTPLNAVLGFSQLLELRYDDQNIKDLSASIQRGGRHLLDLINEILDLARIEAGKLAISVEPVAANSLLGQACDLVSPLAEQNSITIVIDHDACKEVQVMADRQRLLQVFINLLSNAIKYNRSGGRVEVRCFPTDNQMFCIEFKDSGIGIKEEDIPRLFQPFERIGVSHVEGAGLGLVLSRRLTELMDGTLELVSSDSSGTTFAVNLKITTSRDELSKLPSGGLGSWLPSLGRPAKILYIEDNLSNLKLLEQLAAMWDGVELIPAMQGRLGIDLARDHSPDLILLDLHLPDINGDEVFRLLQLDPTTKSIPVVMITADATESQIARLLGAGIRAYLTKPIDISLLTETIKSIIFERSG